MNTQPTTTTTTVEPLRAVGLSTTAASATSEDIGPVIRPTNPIIIGTRVLGRYPHRPSVAYYAPEPATSDDALRVHATLPVTADSVVGLQTIDIPGGGYASIIHPGSMTPSTPTRYSTAG